MNKFKNITLGRLLSFLLALVMTVSLAVSCANDNVNGKTDAEPGENTDNGKEMDETGEKYVYEDGFTVKNLVDNGYKVTTVNVEIEGLDREYHYIIGSDLHVIAESDEVAEDKREYVKGRVRSFTSKSGVTSADQWKTLPDLLNRCGAEAIFFNADMIDYNSKANVDAFGEGLAKLTTPYYYMRADHDSKPSYLANQNNVSASKRQRDLCPNDELFVLEYDKFMIIGVNNPLTNTTKKKLEQIKELFAKGKPVILISHPPFDSLIDDSMAKKLYEREKNNCMLGKNTTYTYFDSNMYKYIETVVADDSPVVEILAGHLHFDYDIMVTEKIHEHVFDLLANFNIGVLNVIPKKQAF